ncbi:hypothetical protein [Vibrio comitans]
MLRVFQYITFFAGGFAVAYFCTGFMLITPKYKDLTDLTTTQCFNRGYDEADKFVCQQAVELTHLEVLNEDY